MPIFLAGLVSFAVALCAVPSFVVLRTQDIVDRPTLSRKIQTHPIALLGGVGIFARPGGGSDDCLCFWLVARRFY